MIKKLNEISVFHLGKQSFFQSFEILMILKNTFWDFTTVNTREIGLGFPIKHFWSHWIWTQSLFFQGSSRSTNIQTWKCSTIFILPSLFRRQLANQYRNWTSLWWNSEFQRCPCLSLSDQYYVAIWRQWSRRLGLWWLIESHLSYRSMLRFDLFFKH